MTQTTLAEDWLAPHPAARMYRVEWTTEDDAGKFRQLYQRDISAVSIVITED